MFIGHFGLGLAFKKTNKLPSLAAIFIAVQFLDLLWPIFCLLGFETFQIEVGNTKLTPINFTDYPYSHSLLMAILWGGIFGVSYFFLTKNKPASILLGLLVLSHWILDLIVHRPDLPLTPFNTSKVGLGLWNSPIFEIILEFSLFLLGTFLYYKSVKPKRKVAFWSLIIFFIVIHLLNLLGPPPPSISAVAWAGNLSWLFVLWAWWIEKK